MSEIKPCPFCGKDASVVRNIAEYPADDKFPAGEYEAYVTIQCTTCGIEMADEYRDDVVAAWNARALQTSLITELVEALKTTLMVAVRNEEGIYADRARAALARAREATP